MVGAIIGNYKIISKLGEGGMGVVYKALDLKLERFCALKILNAQTAQSAQFIERFKREARNQAKLNHPNIIPVYGFVDEQGYLGIAMEFVEGETLEHVIDRRGSLPVAESLDILQQILRGVGYAHQQGFIHRDIKPSNVMIGANGVAKIMDFGISKSIYEKGITKTGTKIGTLLYMSPEQINAEEPTRQSDIYAIGITLYEMLLGITPFESGTEYEIMQGHLKKPAPKLSASLPGIPPFIDKIIARALEKEPSRRFASCEEFNEEIGYALNIVRQGPVAAGSRSPMEEMDVIRKKRSVKFGIYTFLAFIAIIGIVYLFYYLISGLRDIKVNDKTKSDTTFSSRTNPNYQANNPFETINTGVSFNLQSVDFNEAGAGVAVGDSGKIIYTLDNGTTWSEQEPPGGGNFNAVKYVQDLGFMLGGDRGNLFAFVPQDSIMKKLTSPGTDDIVRIESSQTGKLTITGTKGMILVSDDNGKTWTKGETGVETVIYSVDFANKDVGIAVGDNGTLLRTEDGGKKWSLSGSITDTYLKDVKFVGDGAFMIVGGGGQIFRSTDNGESWRKIDVNITAPLISVTFNTPMNGVILSNSGDIFRSEDGGATWKYQQAIANSLINSVTPGKARLYMAASGGALLYINY